MWTGCIYWALVITKCGFSLIIGLPACYLVAADGRLQELNWSKQRHTAWFIDDSVCAGIHYISSAFMEFRSGFICLQKNWSKTFPLNHGAERSENALLCICEQMGASIWQRLLIPCSSFYPYWSKCAWRQVHSLPAFFICNWWALLFSWRRSCC